MPALRPVVIASVLVALPALAKGQTPDSAAAIPALNVTVTRTPAPLSALGAAVTVVDSTMLRRGRLSAGLDEAFAFVPGVVAENRFNYSVDERLSIRGFGARANFGLRGVKVLLDGVPQTLPDGQSQLNNLDLTIVDHAEVLRGGSSALYGNASGGVIAFTTNPVPTAPWTITARGEGATFGTNKEEVTAGARVGNVGGTLAVSRFSTDGFRQQSAAEQKRLSFGLNWRADTATTFTVRLESADDPRAQNPGALTAPELAVNPDSAAAANIRRGADKSLTQTQLALGVHHTSGRVQFDATVFGLTRALVNPLATPPPAPAAANEGTWSGIHRLVSGARASATIDLGLPTLTAGADVQSLQDDRVNKRSVGGVATDTLLVDQRERVAEAGPFVQVVLPIGDRVSVHAGTRYDINHFSVADHLLSDGDASGSRTMTAASGDGGIALRMGSAITAWTNVGTVFETPTTTELANQPSGAGGFNPDLGPQRSVTEEVGARGVFRAFTFDAALYHTITHDAIVPYNEVGGRTYYDNAGAMRTRGAELGVTWAVRPRLALLATWTFTDAIYTDYLVVNPTSVDTLDGHQLAGLPRSVAHIGIRGNVGGGFLVDVDQGLASGMFGDDDNTIRVAGWGAGVTGARVSWQGTIDSWPVAPFAAVLNAFDRRYVGSVTTNGAAGRVFEPSAGRTIYLGMSITAQGR